MSAERIYTRTRILEYVGTLESLNEAFERRQVKGTSPNCWNEGKIRIYEAPVGDGPRALEVGFVRELVKAELNLTRAQYTKPEDKPAWAEGYTAALQWLLEELPL